ncbi:MAG: exosortase/archaeosortase family protein [bacterium]|nr:exosortase/archaeosortase family protein [bacterium]
MINWSKIKYGIVITLVILVYLPTFLWMKYKFLESESNYSHGFLVPVISLFLIWKMKDELKGIPVSPLSNGLILFCVGLLIHLVSRCFLIDFVSGFSLIPVIFGLSLYLLGKNITQKLIFPLGFLVFMVPLPDVLTLFLTFHMKMFATYWSTIAINLIGIPAVMEGAKINLPNDFLEIGAPCSGIRSLITLLALGSLYAYLSPISFLKKISLFLLTIPIALLSNIVRIVFLAFITYVYGQKASLDEPGHSIAGLLVYLVALAGLGACGKVLTWHKEKEVENGE